MKFRKPYQVRRKRSIFQNRFFWLSILIFGIAWIIFYLGVFATLFQIKEIQTSGNEKVQREDLENFIWSKIDQKIGIFPTKSIFLVKLEKVENELFEVFPEISKAKLERKFPNALLLQIQERKPLFIFCKNENPCFYLDEEGIIFEEVPASEESLLKIQDIRSREINLGEKVMEDNLLDSIKQIEEKLSENFGISVKEFAIFEEKIEVKTFSDFEIYFTQKGNVKDQLRNLALVFQEKIPPENRENIEYIDLRFGNRVYYKYRGKPASY